MPTIGVRVDSPTSYSDMKNVIRSVSLSVELSKLYFDVYFFTQHEVAYEYIKKQGFNAFNISNPAFKPKIERQKNYLDVGEDPVEIMKLFEKHGVTNMLIDLPSASEEYYKTYRPLLKRIVQIEDTPKFKTFSNVIINGSLSSLNFEYPKVPKQLLLQGSSFCLLDHELIDMQPKRPRKFVKDILLLIRDHDRFNAATLILKTLLKDESSRSFRIHIVITKFFKYMEELSEISKNHPHITIHTEPGNILQLIHDSDIGITNDLLTIYRLLCSGVPTISFILPDEYNNIEDMKTGNLRKIDKDIQSIWAQKYIGLVTEEEGYENIILKKVNKLLESYTMRNTLSERGRKALDGKGALRVANELKKIIKD
jgi:spore coat polysaccharide biosynthesis predicted glycosyltransferase SpsG